MGKIIPDGKYKGYEKMDESTDKKIVLKKDNTTVTIDIKDDGTHSVKTEASIGSKKNWDDWVNI